jgi:Bacterial Ig-like domain (group 3)
MTTAGCSPGSVAVGQATACTATVTDTATTDQTTPSGTVGFTSTGPGELTGSPCRLSETSPGMASCSVSYTPARSGTPTRSDTITATYSADSTHKSRSGSTAVTVEPASKNDCKQAGWQNYGFTNQGQCIKFVRQG